MHCYYVELKYLRHQSPTHVFLLYCGEILKQQFIFFFISFNKNLKLNKDVCMYMYVVIRCH